MVVTKNQVDLYQGDGHLDRKLGWVDGDEGGFFFTWLDTLDETIDSIEEDLFEGGGGLDEIEVADFLREYLPTTKLGRDTFSN